MSVQSLNFVILFVKDPLISGDFYARLLNLEPTQESATFVMFTMPNGISLGLWSAVTAMPKVTGLPGASEIAFAEKEVDDTYRKWRGLGISMAQEPTTDEAGRTFVALDPDGHRIRVFWPEEPV